MLFIVVLVLLGIGYCAARPPSFGVSSAHSGPHGYYGHYNKCKLQVLPWPMNVECDPDTEAAIELASNFSLVLDETSRSQDSEILKVAMSRYRKFITDLHPLHISRGFLVEPQFLLEQDDDYSYEYTDDIRQVKLSDDSMRRLHVLESLVVNIGEDHLEEAKQLDDDESYELNIFVDENSKARAEIKASTVWGAMYGMETFSQLVERKNIVRYVPVSIKDSPRFPWRGLLLDTSNHFLSVSLIKKFIDTMASVKLNTLHWHLVDSYSFPFLSKMFPGMAEAGAWFYDKDSTTYKNTVYSTSDLESIEAYAKMRGVRIVLEMDMPGR